ncbi:hypothetical protein PA598K_03275 [Paenibacillus sp. 598K]|uniref:hypothetical protein n=1 Tax=Paenibacillus sp. 598K TaxID=1117987 RepID=UPI000FFACF58|nr:hypothetical protein [Paenibacillus sp. 598K]GBF74905.1 hypothetical protein PA598K_03275 [Paenibacillus sp. 598K]
MRRLRSKRVVALAAAAFVAVAALAIWGFSVKGVPGVSEDQRQEYSTWETKGKENIGVYERKLAEMNSGKLESKRITWDEVMKILAQKREFKDQIAEIERIHGTPDFVGGSGVTRMEFWLDDDGKDRITVLLEQGDILRGTEVINR